MVQETKVAYEDTLAVVLKGVVESSEDGAGAAEDELLGKVVTLGGGEAKLEPFPQQAGGRVAMAEAGKPGV